jgi:protein-tyrosine phosphatase
MIAFWRPKPALAPQSLTMIDIHSHILPGLDDGAKSWEVTLEMCRLAIQDGITHIVATPHSNDAYAYSRERVREMIVELDKKVGDQLAFSIGCDFHLSYDNIEDAITHPQRYTIASAQYLLVELSDYGVPPQMNEGLFRLQGAGIVPIITHPERNAILQRQPERVLEWVEKGCLVQVTASALTGSWGPLAKRTAEWLLERDAVHVLATDAHDDKHRPPILSQARAVLSRRFGPDFVGSLVLDNPAAIVAGSPLPRPEPAPSHEQKDLDSECSPETKQRIS